MQVSTRWLKDYVDIDLAPEVLAAKLTMAGLEVESLEIREPAFTGVVVAKILEIKPHPQADKLSLCSVDAGGGIFSVVCGAPNIRPGDVVPFAGVGAVLPNGLKIKEAKIRGELSAGMLCSEDELGIGSDAAGVMILCRTENGAGAVECALDRSPDSRLLLSLGRALGEALGLRDAVFNISITPNRSDCLSVIGIAREIAALTGKKLKYPSTELSETGEDIGGVTSVVIDDPDLCPRYTARLIKNLRVQPSPLWMRLRLEAAGLRPINNVVDVTNFVMLETGQPLHAFDYRYLEEGRIVVRRSREGEAFTTLDGKERPLKAGIVLICDGKRPVAIGGIMGGLNSEVKEDTQTVLLESAYFNPTSIRLAAKWLGMTTDAAFRFERGVDPEGVIRAQNRAAQLMGEICSGQVCKNVIDQYPLRIESSRDIPVRADRVRGILGSPVDRDRMFSILESLEMSVAKTGDQGVFRVTPPTCRVDIEREIDIIEEIGRVYGYDRIPATLPVISVAPSLKETRRDAEQRIRTVLTGRGFSEVITYSFVSPHWGDRLGMKEADDRRRLLRIKNPLSEDQSVMRTTLLCGLLETMKKNVNTGSPDLKIFEIGKVFFARGTGELPKERNSLACLLSGALDDEPMHALRTADFYDLKGVAESILSDLGISGARFCSDLHEPFLHPSRSAGVMIGDNYCGFLGELHRQVLDRLDLKEAAFVMEFNIDALPGEGLRSRFYRDISRYPSITRDVALLLDRTIESDKVLGFVREEDEELLEKVQIFDVYEGKGVPEGKRSLGLRFSYRSSEKTLTDEEIAALHGRLVAKIIDLTGARIR